MKVVLAGAYGNLGSDILRSLMKQGHEVIAADMMQRDLGLEKKVPFQKIDVTNPKSLEGLCEGADLLISTVGLTKTSAVVTNEQIDYQGNVNLLNEAKRAKVKKFIYISVLKADQAPDVPMLDSKFRMEEELKRSGLDYLIYRPTGYFYDIIKVFKPMIEKGSVTLLGKKPVSANVIATEDFADYIVDHLSDQNQVISIGGNEIYTYEEIAKLCFAAAGKQPVIKRAPVFLFRILAWINHFKKNGKEAIIRFSKWTLTESMVSDVKTGNHSFSEYIKSSFH